MAIVNSVIIQLLIRLFDEKRLVIISNNLFISTVYIGFASPVRSSPRLQKTDDYTFNIYVTAGVKPPSTAQGPVYTIHDVSSQANLHAIRKLIREQIPDVCLKAGFFLASQERKAMPCLVHRC